MEAVEGITNKENGDCGDESSSGVAISVRDEDRKRKRTKKKLIKLTFHGLVLLFMGMQLSQRGPAFLDLQLISDTDVKGVSSYITSSNVGYMVGALVAGFLYDRLGNKSILICIPITLGSFLTGLTPRCTSYVTMLLAHFATSLLCASPEATVITEQFAMWQEKSDSALQFLSFTYSLGGVLGPLYTEPFLVPKWMNGSDNPDRHDQTREEDPKTNNVSNAYHSQNASVYHSQNASVYHSQNASVSFTSIAETVSNLTSFVDPPESELFYAYMITGAFGILFSIPFYIMCCKHCSKSSHKEIKKEESTEVVQKRLTLTPYIVLITISSIFFFTFVMTEDTFSVYLAMFVVSHLSWTKENGALISSLYWGISTISKLISVPLVRRFDLGIILLIGCVSMVISMVGFLLSSHYRIDVLIWITCSCFSMSQSTIAGGCLCWVDTHLVKLDGKATSIILIYSALGAMLAPLVLGVTMGTFSLMVFPYIELTISVMSTCIFIFMLFILKPYVSRKYGPVRPKPNVRNINVTLEGNETEMVEIEQKLMTSDNDDADDDNDDNDDDDDDDDNDGEVCVSRLRERTVLQPC